MPGKKSNGGRVDTGVGEPTGKWEAEEILNFFPRQAKPNRVFLQFPVLHPAVTDVKSPGDAATIHTNHQHLAHLGSAENLGQGNVQVVPCCRFGVGYFGIRC